MLCKKNISVNKSSMLLRAYSSKPSMANNRPSSPR